MTWITHTNRKGIIYYLCQSVTRTGKPRYYFSPEPKGEPVEQVPEGYKVHETVSGMVVLMKDRPSLILTSEVQAVQDAVQRRRKPGNYRLEAQGDTIQVYEAIGPDADEWGGLIASMSGGLFRDRFEQAAARQVERRRFEPVLRFILADPEKRTFRAMRRCYRSSMPDWIDLHVVSWGPVDQLARRLVPTLGTEAFFEIY